jgi:hypothetical protein
VLTGTSRKDIICGFDGNDAIISNDTEYDVVDGDTGNNHRAVDVGLDKVTNC